MKLKQSVFWVTWDREQKTWNAEIDGQSVRGALSSVTDKLDERGWEIISVVPMHQLASYSISGFPPVIDISMSSVEALAIFTKKIDR